MVDIDLCVQKPLGVFVVNDRELACVCYTLMWVRMYVRVSVWVHLCVDNTGTEPGWGWGHVALIQLVTRTGQSSLRRLWFYSLWSRKHISGELQHTHYHPWMIVRVQDRGFSSVFTPPSTALIRKLLSWKALLEECGRGMRGNRKRESQWERGRVKEKKKCMWEYYAVPGHQNSQVPDWGLDTALKGREQQQTRIRFWCGCAVSWQSAQRFTLHKIQLKHSLCFWVNLVLPGPSVLCLPGCVLDMNTLILCFSPCTTCAFGSPPNDHTLSFPSPNIYNRNKKRGHGRTDHKDFSLMKIMACLVMCH